MGRPMTLSHLTLSDLIQDRSDFQPLLSCNGAELGHILLLNINRKACMGSSKTLSHLTLSDLERSLRFRSLISRKGAELVHMLL